MPGNDNSTTDTPSFAIKVNGTVVPAEYNVQSVLVQQSVNRLSYARIVFLDGEAASADFKLSNKADFVPGNEVEILAGYHQDNVTIFKGIIIKHAITIKHTKSAFLTIECRHAAVKMTKVRNSKYYSDVKDSEVIEQLIQAARLTADVAASNVQHKEMVQYNATDWDFVTSRADMNGLLVVTAPDKVSVQAPSFSGDAAATLTFGTNIMEMDAEIDARHQFETVTGKAWSAANQQMETSEAAVPGSVTQEGNLATADIAGKTGAPENVLLHTGALDSNELKAWTEAVQLKHTLSKIRGALKCQGNAALAAGSVVQLAGVGNRFNGKALIAAVRHDISQGNWITDIEIGLHHQPFAAEFDVHDQPAAALLPAVHGLQIGVVTQLENDPDGEDRVLVHMPVIDPDAEGVWARQSLLDAGKERGSFFRPEVGDEVVLGFLNDDPRYPVILGMLNSSAKPAVLQAKDTNHEKGLVTREKLKIWFNDDKKSIILETPGGNTLSIDDDQKGISLKDMNGNELTMNDSGITIKSAKDLTVQAAQNYKMSGNAMEAKADTTMKVSGSSSAEVSSSGSTTVKGSMVQIN